MDSNHRPRIYKIRALTTELQVYIWGGGLAFPRFTWGNSVQAIHLYILASMQIALSTPDYLTSSLTPKLLVLPEGFEPS